jgi:hypothetical protein
MQTSAAKQIALARALPPLGSPRMFARTPFHRCFASALAEKPWRLPSLLFAGLGLATLAWFVFAPRVYEAAFAIENSDFSARFAAALKDPSAIERAAARLGIRGTAREISRTHRLETLIAPREDGGAAIRVRAANPELARHWLRALLDEDVAARKTFAAGATNTTPPAIHLLAAVHCVAPNGRKMALMMVIAAGGAIFATRMLIPRLLPHFTSSDEITARFRVPCLGLLPQIISRQADETMSPATMLDEISCEGALAPMVANEQLGRVIVVTSATPGDGKTFVSALLARACASENLKTLVIDASASRDLHRLFGLRPGPGLREYLGGEVEPSAICRPTHSAMLHVATAGNRMDGEQVSMRDLFERLLPAVQAHYDRIIIDTPHLSAWRGALPRDREYAVAMVVPSAGSWAPAMSRTVQGLSARTPRHYCGCIINRVALERSWSGPRPHAAEHPGWEAVVVG